MLGPLDNNDRRSAAGGDYGHGALRFDHWTKRIATSTRSRRGLLRLGLGGGAAALLFSQGAEEALACRRTRKPCAKNKKNGNCCSGTCRKGKCRPTRGAAGCTVNQDVCAAGITERCPSNPKGFCIKLDNGKPFCYEDGRCAPCATNADCTEQPDGKCLTSCRFCNEKSGGQVCVYPKRVV